MNKTQTPVASFAGYALVQTVLVSAAVILGVIEQYRFGPEYTGSIMPYIGRLFNLGVFLAFGSIVIHLAWQYYFCWRWRCLTTFPLVVLYVSSYCLLSVNGEYHASRSRHNRWNEIGVAVVDRQLWHAKGVFLQHFRTIDCQDTIQATYLGYFYRPLIGFDRALVHRTINLMEVQQ